MRIRQIPVIVSFLTLVSPGMTTALQVEINGKTLQPEFEGNPCIDITGEYPGFTIVPSEAGKIPQICFDGYRK